MTEKRFTLIDGIKKGTHSGIWDKQKQNNQRIGDELWIGEVVSMLNEGVMIAEENEQLKSTIAQLIEQNRKNNDLLLSDIRILEKALWCSGCENDYGRLKELRKEFIR